MKNPDESLRAITTFLEALADAVGRLAGQISRGVDQISRCLDYLVQAIKQITRGAEQTAEETARVAAVMAAFVAAAVRAASAPPVAQLHRGKDPGQGALLLASLLLPGARRAEWLEEQRGYLSDLSTHWEKLRWIAGLVLGMPRYAYTVRTGTRKESA